MIPNASPEVKERLIKEFGLDRPIHVQYWQWLKRAVRLDFGRSFLPDGRPVLTKIGERLPVTLFLNVIEAGHHRGARGPHRRALGHPPVLALRQDHHRLRLRGLRHPGFLARAAPD